MMDPQTDKTRTVLFSLARSLAPSCLDRDLYADPEPLNDNPGLAVQASSKIRE